jgi:hypothetical protein
MFVNPPVVVKRGEAYFLRWKQGTYPFYFYPDDEVRNGQLWFAMGATTSTGNASGREIEIPIKGKRKVEALKQGGAVWWEPDRSTVSLEVVVERTPN